MSNVSSSVLLLEAPAAPRVIVIPSPRGAAAIEVLTATPGAALALGVPTPAVKRRDADLDACRVLASLGVVWVHAATTLSSGVGRFAVPMFTIMSVVFVALALRKRPDESSLAFVGRRWGKLYPAFLFWCVVYALLSQVKQVVDGGLSSMHLELLDFVGGTQEHLWFLPFLLVGTCVVVPLLRLAIRDRVARIAIGWSAVAVAIAWAAAPIPARVSAWGPASPWHWLVHAWWATPSMFMGLALGCLAISRGSGVRVPHALGLAGVALFAVGSYVNWRVDYQPVLLASTSAGVGMFWIAGSGLLPRRLVAALAPVGACGMGIYLCHPMILHVLSMVTDHLRLTPSAAMDATRFAVAVAGALAIAWTLGRTRYTRWTIGI